MAAIAGLTRAISGLSLCAAASAPTIPACSGTRSSSSAFVSYSGLSAERSFSKISPRADRCIRRESLSRQHEGLFIEAKHPTRRESVKVRHRRIRKKLSGTTERPRLAVFRSSKHIYAQVIDDTQHITLCASSTLKPELREELKLTSGPNIAAAKRVGEDIGKLCLEKGITKLSYDRGGFVYHGRIQALAEAVREAGLDF